MEKLNPLKIRPINLKLIKLFRLIFTILSLLNLPAISPVLVEKDESLLNYNFIDYQNYEIDLAYRHILGTNIYFYPKSINDSLFIATVFPELTLKMNLKLYTNNSEIIETISQGGSIYLGLDLNIKNTDITIPDLRSDIVVCCLSSYSGECHDFAFNTTSGLYIKNDEIEGESKNDVNSDSDNTENLIRNNLIPKNFNKTGVDVILKNVIEFDAYFAVRWEKNYYKDFDNKTMFNWFDSGAIAQNATVYAFFGTGGGGTCELFNSGFDKSQALFYGESKFAEGEGLDLGTNRLNLNLYKIIILLLSIYHLLF